MGLEEAPAEVSVEAAGVEEEGVGEVEDKEHTHSHLGEMVDRVSDLTYEMMNILLIIIK